MADEMKGQWVTFWIGEQPELVFVTGLPDRSRNFYRTIRPDFFWTWVAEIGRSLDDPEALDDVVGERASAEAQTRVHQLRMRYTYLHFLEVFFAHLFANVQCPAAPDIWLSRYKVKTLKQLTEGLLSEPWESGPGRAALARPREFVGWLFGLHQFRLEGVDLEAAADRTVSLVRRFASEYVDSRVALEYNAIKHGSRGRPAAFRVSLGTSGIPGWDGGDIKLGTDMGIAMTDLKRVGPNKWIAKQVSHGWGVDRDRRLAQVLALVLGNMVQARGIQSGWRYCHHWEFDDPGWFEGQPDLLHFDMVPALDGEGPMLSGSELRKAAIEQDQHAADQIRRMWTQRVGGEGEE